MGEVSSRSSLIHKCRGVLHMYVVDSCSSDIYLFCMGVVYKYYRATNVSHIVDVQRLFRHSL